MDHRLLFEKLHHYGFYDKIIKWIESFLSDKYQKVVVEVRISFLTFILSGVPRPYFVPNLH